MNLTRFRAALPARLVLGAFLACACEPTLAGGAAPMVQPKAFATPEQASEALIAAAERFDTAALKEILGPDGVDLAVTEDLVQSKNQCAAFAAQARQKTTIERDPGDPKLATVVVGAEAWPMPIPIVESAGGWRFDPDAGREEIVFRRVGRNELDAIDACLNYVDAQHEYALVKHDGAKVNQYAMHILSSPGKRDGLAWKAADGTWQGPLGEAVARVIAEGYSDRYEPYHGYYFKILKSQGAAAPLGAIDFLVKGAMIGGFALVASPAEYGVTGIKTFIVSHDGVVFEKDLGSKTPESFKAMERYNPDKSWSPVEAP